MAYAEDFQTLGLFRTQYDSTFAGFFDDSMKGVPQSHQVPFEVYRAEPGKFLIKRYNDEKIGSIGREHSVQCPVTSPAGSVKLLVYEPEMKQGDGPFPVYFHIHGTSSLTWGGFVGGAPGMDAPWLRVLVKDLNMIVIDIEYRLAPEFPAPTSGEDCWDALQFVMRQAKFLNIDLSRVSIGGVSAGANLATVTALRARDAGIPLLFQLLVVPVTDAAIFNAEGKTSEEACVYESWRSMSGNPVLSKDRMAWFWDLYLGENGSAERKVLENDWKISPIKVESLKGLPPTFVATAEIDILRDEGEAYVQRLIQDGVPVQSSRYLGMPHTFLHYGDRLEEAGRLQREIVEAFRAILGP